MASFVKFYSVDATLQNGATATGNGTEFELNGAYGSLTLQIIGTFVATVTFEISNDGGTTYTAVSGINKGTGDVATTVATAGFYTVPVTGIKRFRARISAFTSGSVTVYGTAVTSSEPVRQLSDVSVPACRVYHNAAQSIADATYTTLAFNSERFDTDTMHDTATNNSRITFTTAGVYVVTACVEYAANATGYRLLEFVLNGTTAIGLNSTNALAGSATTYISVSGIYQFSAGNYIEVFTRQTSGGALNVNGVGNYSPEFAAVRVG